MTKIMHRDEEFGGMEIYKDASLIVFTVKSQPSESGSESNQIGTFLEIAPFNRDTKVSIRVHNLTRCTNTLQNYL